MEYKDIVVFKEEQRFRQVWLWAIVLGISFVYMYSFIDQVLIKKSFNFDSSSNQIEGLVGFFIMFGLPYIMYSMNLRTEVRNDGLYIRFFPFHWSYRKVDLSTVTKIEARTYNPIMEYGGWGIKFGARGSVYNVYGNRGLQLDFSNRSGLLIGSQKPEQLANAVEVLVKKTSKQKPTTK